METNADQEGDSSILNKVANKGLTEDMHLS